MLNKLGLESLIQSGRSAFFEDLVSVYKRSQDALREAYSASQADIFVTLKKLGLDTDIKDIVEKRLGIKLSIVDIVESVSPNLMAKAKANRTYLRATKKKTKTSGMMFEEINRLYNNRTSKLDNYPKIDLPFSFSISVHTSMWMLRNQDKSFYFTAENLAAATLHEIGHIDDWIRNCSRIVNNNIDAADIIDYINHTPDKAVIDGLISNIKKSPHLDKSWLTLVQETEQYFKTTNSFDNSAYYEALSVLTTIVTSEVGSRNLPFINSLIESNKFSKVRTRLSNVDEERAADEFASRNGAYRDLIEMVAKLNQLATTKTDLVFRQFLWYTPSIILGLLIQFTTMFDLSAGDISGGYDPIIRRLELIVETAKHSFSEASLSDESKVDIKRQIVESEQYIKDYNSTFHSKVRESIKIWKSNVSKFGRIIKSPVQDRLVGDYERLQDSTRSLSRNPLYYLADKTQ